MIKESEKEIPPERTETMDTNTGGFRNVDYCEIHHRGAAIVERYNNPDGTVTHVLSCGHNVSGNLSAVPVIL